MRNFLIWFLIVLIPAVSNAYWICKPIWPDSRFPHIPMFYRCRSIVNMETESDDVKEFYKGYY